MADAMATARMSQEKKNAASEVFDGLGLTASSAINQFYDYVISNKALPFDKKQQRTLSQEDFTEAKNFIMGLASKPTDERFAMMTLKDAKRERLMAKGLLPKEEAR